ncbi:hypothetical protein PCIT_a2956 [Pseudoalteromonas citrea]|uniref:Uncharacterized protein n=1 Tax=Pseudoalteromonas citrea TaxID=43655 RepID=A0AAD4AI58_9GAMM|nr:hypothetical protein PCIT_a2956 [Pseudoalteromonas citrea]
MIILFHDFPYGTNAHNCASVALLKRDNCKVSDLTGDKLLSHT